MLAPFTKPTGHNILFLTVSLLFHHNTLTNKLDWQYFSLVCLSFPPFIHPPLPPPSSPPPPHTIDAYSPWGHAMLAEALCCERVLCLPSIWVSYRGRRFKRSSPLHADTSCASTRADYPRRSVRACKCVCVCVMGWIRGVCVLCPRIDMCVCVSSYCMYVFGLRVYSLRGFRSLAWAFCQLTL